MGIPIPVEAKLDQRSATAAANRAERVFADAGRDAGKAFTSGFKVDGVERDLKKIGDKASDSYDRARDAAGKLRSEEEKLQNLRERGARNDQVVSQAERVEKARRAEVRAIRDATNAYEDYERAAESAGRQGGENFLSGLSGAGAGSSGQDMADEFAGGFAGSTMLARLGLAGGPIGLALAGAAALGVVAGRELARGIAEGMATIQMQDVFQGRMGLDEASMAQYASAAGAAYANNWGASVADNLAAAQVALQSGIIDTGATDAEVQTVIEQLQGMTVVTDATAAELSRSITTMMRTGMADSVSEASDIIVAGFQGGLNISGDWLDTLNEYSTQFRKLGLDADQVLTLLSQGLEGGARDTDKVADSLKEFSIRAVDGSKTTREGFEALGFSADEMARRFAEGGDAATVALGATLEALRGIDDPMQQALIWQRLFGTQFEDMGDAINQFDMSSVGAEFSALQGTAESSTKAATDNFKTEWEAATRTVEQYFTDLKTGLADWATSLPIIRDIPNAIQNMFGDGPRVTPGGPVVPAIVAPTTTSGGVQGPGITGGVGPAVAPPPGGGHSTVQNPLQNPLLAPFVPGGLPAPSVVTPASPSAPVQGPQIPILTDAQAEAQKEIERFAASGGVAASSAPRSTSAAQPRPQVTVEDFGTAARTDLQNVSGEIGSALDQDLGISKGLPGIVENAVRAVASFAAAPLVGPLSAISNAAGDEGSGLMGILASTGALGSQFTPGASNIGPAALQPGALGLPSPAASGPGGTNPAIGQIAEIAGDFGLVLTSGRRNEPGSHHNEGEAGDFAPPGGGRDTDSMLAFATYMRENFGGDLAELIYHDPRFSGSQIDEGRAVPDSVFAGAGDHHDHVHVATRSPTLSGSGRGALGSPSFASTGLRSSGGPVPVFVVNMAGMAGGVFGSPLAGPGGSPAAQGVGAPSTAGPGALSAPLAPLPAGIGGGGGPLGLPGVGMPQSFGPGTSLGGQSYPGQGGGEGGIGLGGMALDGIMAATSGLDMLAPGAGAAAKIGIQVANRTAKYAGQVAGIGIGGLLDTITPAGDNPKASIGNSWFGKIAGGIASAAPALPNMAGKKPAPPNPNDPGAGEQGQGGNTINNTVNMTNNHATEDMAGNQTVREMGAMYSAPGSQ
ncbi:MAG: phage tail tape measure protein [Actinomycetia bacterium]|nr:phage tail tape measure protein [Actinomycetes bacterium]